MDTNKEGVETEVTEEDVYKSKGDALKDYMVGTIGKGVYYKLVGDANKGNIYGYIDRDNRTFEKVRVWFEEVQKPTGKTNNKGEEKTRTFFRVEKLLGVESIPIGRKILVDKFAIKYVIQLNERDSIAIETFEGSGSIEDFELEVQGDLVESIDYVDRKWINKIFGYRSKNKGKMIVSSIFYLLFSLVSLIIVLGIAFGGGDEKINEDADSNKDAEVEDATKVTQDDKNDEDNKQSESGKEDKSGDENKEEKNEENIDLVENDNKEVSKEISEGVSEENSEENIEDVELTKDEEEEILAKMTETTIRQSMGEMVEVEYDEVNKIYELYPHEGEYADAITIVVTTGQGQEDWDSMVDSFIGLSNSIQDTVGDGYSVALHNPLNRELIILAIVDGTVMYDVTKDY